MGGKQREFSMKDTQHGKEFRGKSNNYLVYWEFIEFIEHYL